MSICAVHKCYIYRSIKVRDIELFYPILLFPKPAKRTKWKKKEQWRRQRFEERTWILDVPIPRNKIDRDPVTNRFDRQENFQFPSSSDQSHLVYMQCDAYIDHCIRISLFIGVTKINVSIKTLIMAQSRLRDVFILSVTGLNVQKSY